MRAAQTLCLAGAVLLFGCEPKVVQYRVNIVTRTCQAPNPLEGVTHLRVRVMGPGLPAPLEVVSPLSASEQSVDVPEIPAGEGRTVEVRAYAGAPAAGGRIVSIGRTLPFAVPEVVPTEAPQPELNVFLRQVNTFTPPSAAAAPGSCSQMLQPRAGHTATLLPDGRVFIAGGYQLLNGTERVALEKAELYNPATGAFEEARDIGVVTSQQVFTRLARAFHTATLLNSGQVLLWGGEEYPPGNSQGLPAQARASVLVYDQEKDAYGGVPFSNLPNVGRAHHAMAADEGGRLLILGGLNLGDPEAPQVVDRVEWFDPDSLRGDLLRDPSQSPEADGTFPPRSLALTGAAMTAVQGGARVAVVGGWDGAVVRRDVTLFGFDGQTFQPVSPAAPVQLKSARRGAAVVTFRESNDLLVLGGYEGAAGQEPLGTSEVVSTQTFSVSDGPSLRTPRGDLCVATLPDGRVLAVGGRTEAGLNDARLVSDGTVELLTPQREGDVLAITQETLAVARHYHTCTALADGTVLVLGGAKDTAVQSSVLQDALIFTPEPLDP